MFLIISWKLNVYTFIPLNNPNILTLHISQNNEPFPQLCSTSSSTQVWFYNRDAEYFCLYRGPQESPHFKHVWLRELLFGLQAIVVSDSLQLQELCCSCLRHQTLSVSGVWAQVPKCLDRADPYHLSVLIQITH